ncbi:MAG TPA: pyrroline-5-carboxylate reductase [Burkholderiales bacterium]|nr:pyrroline-5-carboxylate reductase [Burkholderiales bacterium]
MNVTFIGGGNMATALIGGLLDKGFCRNEELRAVEISGEACTKLKQKYGIKCFAQARKAWAERDGDIIVFAVKPQQMREAARKSGLAANANLVVSVAAGITLTSLSRWLGGHRHLIRAMPNTPALIGEGITGLYALPEVTENERKKAEAILSAVGPTVWIRDQVQMDAVTAISGSGPAYVFYFIEAIEEAAKQLGLPLETAHKLALQTFLGAAKLAATSSDALAVLRERVTSKGGTTERALASMEADKVKEAIVRAILAAAERSRELGDELGEAD